MDIAPELQSTLNANGMQAQIAMTNDGRYELIALAHNTSSPTRYTLNAQQFDALTSGGTIVQNKKAYQTFVSIVKNDYYIPDSWVSAKNANSPVNMGQNGHRISPGEYGYIGERPFGPFRGGQYGRFNDFLGGLFGGRQGYHLRRIEGRPFYASSAPVVADRPDGRLKPGELLAGGYGFYRKENNSKDGLSNLSIETTPLVLNRPKGKATTLQEFIGDYRTTLTFSGNSFKDFLAQHGVVIDKDKKTLTIQSDGVNKDFQYKLKDEELALILNDKLKFEKDGKSPKIVNPEAPNISDRLDVINNIISIDFKDKITKEQLNSRNYISIQLKPEVEQELGLATPSERTIQPSDPSTIIDMRDQRLDYNTGFVDKWNSIGVVDGRSLDNNSGFYLPVKDGRAISVGEIQAYPTNDGQKTSYRMTAVINNQVVSHDISEKDYVKFLNYDDDHRLKLFDKVFDEVAIKSASNGPLQDPVESRNLDQANGVVTLKGDYSLVNQNTTAAITAAQAWKDQRSGDYLINVRTNKDVGMWSFKITEAQYEQFKNSTDKEKAAMLTTLIPFKDKSQEALRVVDSRTLAVHPMPEMNGNALLEKAAMEINATPNLQAEIVDDPQLLEKLKELNRVVIEKASREGLGNVKMLSNEELLKIAAQSRSSSEVVQGIINKSVGENGIENSKMQKIIDDVPKNLSLVLNELLVIGKQEKPLADTRNAVEYGEQLINLNDLRTATKLNLLGEAGVNGESLENIKPSKEWKRSGDHGRDTEVSDIAVEKVRDAQGNVVAGKYKMSAIIDGNVISHEINQKQFDKFLAVNDFQRMKLFDKIFPEVEMKTKPGHGLNLGAAILAAITTGLDVAGYATSMLAPSRPSPAIYEAKVFSKEGVASPAAVAAASYESLRNDQELGNEESMGLGR